MLSWFSDLMITCAAVFPRLKHVPQTHRAVKLRGKGAIELGPGLWWWWPVTTQIVELPVARQTTNLATQMLTTSDGRSIALSGVVVFSIRSALDAVVRNWDHEETLSDIALCAIAEVVTARTLDELVEQFRDGRLERELTKKTRRRLRPFGVFVDRCALTDFAPCRALRLFQS